LDGLDHQVSIIARWDIAALLEFKDAVVLEFFAVCHAVSFGPLYLTRVLLRLEELVAFAAAEAEDLGVIAAESSPVAWVDIARAEVALIDMHFN
jgi:hypothetical protein